VTGRKRPERRTTPVQQQDGAAHDAEGLLRRGRSEMRKVAWPSRKEVVNSIIVVLIAVRFMTSLDLPA